MKRILVLGAGASAPFLIHQLLQDAQRHDWFVTVGDRDLPAAQKIVGETGRASAMEFDVNDPELLSTQIAKSDLVVNMLAPRFQPLVARDCIHQGRPMVSASYRDDLTRQLDLYRDDMGRDFKFRMSDIENLLYDMEKRGNAYFDEMMRMGRIFDLINKDRIQQGFETQVVADLPRSIEGKVTELIDWLAGS